MFLVTAATLEKATCALDFYMDDHLLVYCSISIFLYSFDLFKILVLYWVLFIGTTTFFGPLSLYFLIQLYNILTITFTAEILKGMGAGYVICILAGNCRKSLELFSLKVSSYWRMRLGEFGSDHLVVIE